MTRAARSRHVASRGTLAVIAGLMIASGLLRAGNDAGRAFAIGAQDETTPAPLVCEPQEAPVALLDALRQREERATEREARIEDRMQALRLAEAAIDERLAAMAEAEASLAATLQRADGAAEADIGRLTLVYENMQPAVVARLFEQMVPEFSAGFLARMAPEAAAAVMTELDPMVAYSISVVIAARNSSVPVD